MGNINSYIFVKLVLLLLYFYPNHAVSKAIGDANQFIIKFNKDAVGELVNNFRFCAEKSTLSCQRMDIRTLDGMRGVILQREYDFGGKTWWLLELSNGQRVYYSELYLKKSVSPINSPKGELISPEVNRLEEAEKGRKVVAGSPLSISQYNSRADSYLVSGSSNWMSGERFRALEEILSSISTRKFDQEILDIYEQMELKRNKFKGSLVLIPESPEISISQKPATIRLIVGLDNGEPEATLQFLHASESLYEIENSELAAANNHITFDSPVFETKRVNENLFVNIAHLYFLEKHRVVITSILDDLDATLRFNTVDGHTEYKFDSMDREYLQDSLWLYDILVNYNTHRPPFN